MKLAQINTEFNYRMNIIDRFYKRLKANYLIDTFTTMKLKSLSFNYDWLFYSLSIENLKQLRSYVNGLVSIMQAENMAVLSTGEIISELGSVPILRLVMSGFETDLQNYFNQIDNLLNQIDTAFNLFMPTDAVTLEPFPEQMENRGYKIISHLPEPSWATTQGAGFDDEYMYVFGSPSGVGSPMMLAVTHKNDTKRSFIANGSLGLFVSGSGASDPKNWQYALGHANDCAVVRQIGDEVTLLVASMIPNELATCIVNLKTQTAQLGKRISVSGFNGGIASIQIMPNGQVMATADGYYKTADFDESGMTFETFARRPIMTDLVKDLGFDDKATGQADWYENGYLYISVWLANLRKSMIIETIPQGPDERAIMSNRYWWDEEAGRRFEIEKVWMENDEFYANVSMNNPYDNFIMQPNWKENNE